MKFLVTITEKLEMDDIVEAENANEAKKIVEERYTNGEYCLDYGDYVETEIKTVGEVKECRLFYTVS